MLDSVNDVIIEQTIKSYMSDESVTIEGAISDANDLVDVKTSVMFNILDEAEKIEKYIFSEDRSVVNTIKRHNVGQSGFMTDKPQHYYEHYGSNKADEEATGLLAEEEATGLLNGADEDTGLLNNYDEEATCLLNTQCEQIHYASMYRLLTNETFLINKPVFRIGKEKSYSDYFVANNNMVSRSHADIISRGERYFIVDLNSKNKTFVNGTPILAQQETEIHDGDAIRLANEEFEFRI